MLLQAVTCSCLLLVCSVSVGKAESFEASEEDEFSSLPDTSLRTEPATGGAPGTWGDEKVSLLGFLSLKWAEQDIELGTTEVFSVIVIVCYLLVYIRGRHRSYEIAESFIRRVHGLFCSRFLEAGPASQIPPSDRRQLLARESPNNFLYYATGHRACDGVLMRISLIPRHDIFMLAWNMFSPVKDTVTIEVALDEGDMEPMVFAITRKRSVKQLLADVPHIQDYAGVVRSPTIPSELACVAESPAHVECLLPTGAATLGEYHDLVDLVHFTDQNVVAISGRTDTPKKVLRFRFRLEGDLRGAEKMVELALTYLEFLHRSVVSPLSAVVQ